MEQNHAMKVNHTYTGNAYDVLKTFPSESIHSCVTSPPYYGLRDYGLDKTHWPEVRFIPNYMLPEIVIPEMECCLGLEDNPWQYIGHLITVFREIKRVLRKDGSIWINIGDSYAGGKIGRDDQAHFYSMMHGSKAGKTIGKAVRRKEHRGIRRKDLMGIPWMLAFALRSDGWRLRQDIIWHKPNPMRESVKDRCTRSHEHLFHLSRSRFYYYDADAIKTPITDSSVSRLGQDIENQNGSDRVIGKNKPMKAVIFGGNKAKDHPDRRYSGKKWEAKGYEHRGGRDQNFNGHSGYKDANGNLIGNGMANKTDVWTVPTAVCKEAHFATFPEGLIVDCIKAGCPPNGIVLDPFSGSGRTGITATKNGRNRIDIEMSPDYIGIQDKLRHKELGIFK